LAAIERSFVARPRSYQRNGIKSQNGRTKEVKVQKEGKVSRRKISWLPLLVGLLVVASVVAIVLPKKAHAGPVGGLVHVNALPQFARHYNLKCSACHTIAPVLNEQGMLFQRLGYHLPPSLLSGEAAPHLSEIKGGGEWNFANNVSVAVADFS